MFSHLEVLLVDFLAFIHSLGAYLKTQKVSVDWSKECLWSLSEETSGFCSLVGLRSFITYICLIITFKHPTSPKKENMPLCSTEKASAIVSVLHH
jgi:hypothetical protein